MKLSIRHSNWLWAYCFIAPTVLGLYLFYLYPIAVSVFYSFTKWNPLISPEFIGLENYRRIFTEPVVLNELFNTFFFVILIVPSTVIISLIIANALNRASRLNGIFRTIFFLPYIILPVATAQVWRIMFNSRFGLINALLNMLNLPQPLWFEDKWLVRFIIIISSLWGSIGYYSIIVLSGLQNIPEQYYEACELDGGNSWHKFRNITVPLVTPQLFFTATISAIGIFQLFNPIYVFGKANIFVRESIRTLAFGVYERGFTYFEMGFASAEAIILCLIILLVTIIQNIGQKKWVYYN